ncbi:hypothetical protein DdX_17659 [Ditylenchus destructor]|uniref:Uncharacterized protein n=1 Tax=Ditylenchus destructor TaxID=166010 RepID=A0AAD4ML01_9BILA|nr:hypothetical protein DdX_17659 [Ditylenchus destructor]
MPIFGCCYPLIIRLSVPCKEAREQKRINREIEERIRRYRRSAKDECKLLLLGKSYPKHLNRPVNSI